ncbi:flavodoxin family protein [bacterium]|nr:flavodoxin family protein [bacterium]
MKAVILNGTENNNKQLDQICSIISEELKAIEWEVESIPIRDLKITNCVGCFECWVKTPGICRFNDDGREIAKKYIQSDLAVLFTPVTFGGYSSELKKALDRIICLILPFFTKKNNETHHQLRYGQYPRLLGLGVLPRADEKKERIFNTLIDRNAVNFAPSAYAGDVLYSSQNQEEIRKQIKSLLYSIEVM